MGSRGLGCTACQEAWMVGTAPVVAHNSIVIGSSRQNTNTIPGVRACVVDGNRRHAPVFRAFVYDWAKRTRPGPLMQTPLTF